MARHAHGRQTPDLVEEEVREALERLDPLWDELFPAEQARIVQLLVERVDVRTDRVDIRLGAVADVVEIWMTLSPAFSGYRVMRQRQAFADPS